MQAADVIKIFQNHHVAVTELNAITGSFDKQIFLVNNSLVIRSSSQDMQREQFSFNRIAALDNVPKIRFSGRYAAAKPLYYTIIDMLPGHDLIAAAPAMTSRQQIQLGSAIAGFLDRLHGIGGTQYDIGHYLPLLPEFSGSWQAGHARYWEYLQDNLAKIPLPPSSQVIVNTAFSYLQSHSQALAYQAGPVLVHNDFHPKNIIVADGNFSGVIDWECSQFAEADFELCHLMHWCLYPPHAELDFRPFLRGLFDTGPKCTQVPDLSLRLTIYEIEHELIQLMWSQGQSEADRIPKLAFWLEGSVDRLLTSL